MQRPHASSNLFLASLFIVGASTPALAAGMDEDFASSIGDFVVSASKQKESISEAPVPVTVITAEMIKSSGARTLKDLLILYVPGMNFTQDHNEVNVAMRGIYGSSQQKILIMQDGHRLNTRTYAEANPDFAISLDKIKQIEVLRGPGSSLYGNVALTGVVNIITKQGKDINGSVASMGLGSYGERKFSFLHGKDFGKNQDLVLWGQVYSCDGNPVNVPSSQDFSDKPTNGYSLLGGFKDKPSYDLGLKYKSGSLSLFANSASSKYIEPFTAGGTPTGEAYKYDDYPKYNGLGPGLTTDFSHLGATYNKDLGNGLSFDLNPYVDLSNVVVYMVTDPASKSFALPSFNDLDAGAITQLTKAYDLGEKGKGSLLVGAQVDYMNQYSSFYPTGTNGVLNGFGDTVKPLLENGTETVYSGFGQLKHKFSDKLIASAGLRYDEKKRHEGDNVRDLSPRLAMIYLPNKAFDVKLSYAKSFVDAPYWYRYNSLASYSGSRDLKPEHLGAIQLTPSFYFFDRRLTTTTNFFYQNLTDFIYRDPNATGTMPKYRNAGTLDSTGIEEEIAFIQKDYKIRANATYQKPVKAENVPANGNDLYNIPSFNANLNLDVTPLASYRDFTVHMNTRYEGNRLSPIINDFSNGAAYTNMSNRLDPAVVFDLGTDVVSPWNKNYSLSANVYNLFDKQYSEGGSVIHPYLQAGRTFLTTLSAKF